MRRLFWKNEFGISSLMFSAYNRLLLAAPSHIDIFAYIYHASRCEREESKELRSKKSNPKQLTTYTAQLFPKTRPARHSVCRLRASTLCFPFRCSSPCLMHRRPSSRCTPPAWRGALRVFVAGMRFRGAISRHFYSAKKTSIG